MTPGARVAAAIDVLHDMNDGLAAEQALTRWARRSRFAGSKDRAAIRDHVFDVLRSRHTAAQKGGGDHPRALMIGILRHQQADLDALFSGQGHAPVPLSVQEREIVVSQDEPEAQWNLPDWIIRHFIESLGDKALQTARALQTRAPVCLRVNLARVKVEDAVTSLQAQGVIVQKNTLAPGALTVVEGARKIRNSSDYLEGHIELQDAASQAVVAALPSGGRVLDYCAGGGGKTLALCMDSTRDVFAHDIDPRRMSDLGPRATRAGANVTLVETQDLEKNAPFDVVLCDVPCSGSGAWRRAAEGKWTLTSERLADLTAMQDQILDSAAELAGTLGVLAYATCSVLRTENEDRVAAFLARHDGWRCTFEKRFAVGPEGDGFYTAHLKREA